MSIEIKQLTHFYQRHTPFEVAALNHITTTIKEGTMTALIGHTGSGKSTLVKHLNGLLLPDEGQIHIADDVITADNHKRSFVDLRKQVGLVFQFPEAQLFEETVLKDVMFGPLNFGYTKSDSEQRAKEALTQVGLDESFYLRHPHELSGGQMRRVAIAGVIASQPKILILDEPTAGLDPKGHDDMMTLFKQFKAQGMTLIMVTHQMDDVAQYCDDVIVMENGEILKQGSPSDIFQEVEWLYEHHLTTPAITQFAFNLKQRNGFYASRLPVTIDEFMTQWRMENE